MKQRTILLYLLSPFFCFPHLAADPAGSRFEITVSSMLGDQSDGNKVKVSAILRDGTLLVGGHLGATPVASEARPIEDARPDSPWVLLHLSADGRRVLRGFRFRHPLSELTLDGKDRIYLAAGNHGVFVFEPDFSGLIRHHGDLGFAYRISAGPTGHYAVLVPDNPPQRENTGGNGTIIIFDPEGNELGRGGGHRHTLDIAVDEANRVVLHTGWRQARSWQPDGDQRRLPVQIAYIRALNFDGSLKWRGYDWDTTRGSDRFLNRSNNNMADTRGYRATLGPDGLLYVAFEVAGGNHIFRYSPHDITENVSSRFSSSPDHFHRFHNTRAEHKTFIGVYDPADGSFVRGQHFTARLRDGRGSAWRSRESGLVVAENGEVWLGGSSGAGIPHTFVQPTRPGYTGGANLHGFTPEMDQRIFGTYHGNGRTHTVSVRQLPGNPYPTILYGGRIAAPSADEDFYSRNPLQAERGGGEQDGFFVLINANR